MKNQVTLEKKITFVVAGIEFDDLKVAQFFQRAMNRMNLHNGKDARELLDTWAAATHEECGDAELVEVVMGLQLPKPAPKKFTTLAELLDLKKKNVQVLAGDPQTKEFWDEHHAKNQFLEPTLDEQEEAIDAFDTTFALKA